MEFKLFILRSVSTESCPKCKSTATLDRVKKSGIADKLLLEIFQTRTYHCRNCKWQGKIFLYKIRNNARRILINYILVLAGFILFILLMNILLKK